MDLIIDHHLSLSDAYTCVRQGGSVQLSEAAATRIADCRAFLDDFLNENDRPVYGINTGFGSLCNVVVGDEDLGRLQENLVRSHACGMGDLVHRDIVKLVLLLKIQGLAQGHSGVQLATVQLLCDFFDRDILPVVYAQGSLGASGDLAPLAHMALCLFGEGEVWYKGQRRATAQVLSEEGLQPIRLQSKEGLALLNGTQFMSAHATYLLGEAERLSTWADLIAAMSLEAMDGHLSPFDADIHRVRAHAGQISTAARMRAILEGSQLIGRDKAHVQDPYCLRCIPQVHGASVDNLTHIRSTVQTEVDSVTDNPTIFPESGKIISAGNFHGQPLAIALDLMSIALAELGSISERRTYKLNSGQRGLPSFLVKEPGLNSGFMIAQYTAASIVSENKQLCTPASVDTIDSSQGQEDHVSMGANAATQAHRVLDNLRKLLAIELFNAAQGLEFQGLDKTSAPLQSLHRAFRKQVPFVEQDVEMHVHMHAAKDFIQTRDPQDYLSSRG